MWEPGSGVCWAYLEQKDEMDGMREPSALHVVGVDLANRTLRIQLRLR